MVVGLLGTAEAAVACAPLISHARATASLVYARLHGPDPHRLYAGSYPDADLAWWAARIHEWAAQGRDVHLYFHNDGGGHAVRDSARLRALVA